MSTLLDSIVQATTGRATTPQTAAERNTARATADAAMAVRAGFALPEPVYTLGSPVNATGRDNARRLRAAWEAKPRIGEAMDQLISVIDGEKRRDVPVQISALTINPETGRVHRPNGAGKVGLYMDPRAWSQLLSLVPAAPKYAAGYLGDLDPAWRAEEWTRIQARAAEVNPDAAVTLRVRFPGGDTERPTCFAAISDDYAAFGVRETAATLQRLARTGALPAGLRCDVAYRGGSARIDLEGFSDAPADGYVAGEVFKAGISLRPTDDKTGSNTGWATLVRNLCLNLIILGMARQQLFSVRHRGTAADLEAALVAGLKRANEMVGGFLSQWNIAQHDAIDVIETAKRLTAAEEGARKAEALISVPGVAAPMLLNWILEAHRMEPANTRTGLVNAISRAPQVGSWPDPIAAEDILARGAARVLEMVDLPMVAARN